MKTNVNVPVKPLQASKLLILIVLSLFLFSCSVQQQISQTKQFSLCTFRVDSIMDVHLAGIPLRKGMKKADLNAGQMMQLAGSMFTGTLPLDFTVALKVINPNAKKAALSKLDYQVLLDGHLLIEGSLNEAVTVMPNDSSTLRIPVGADIFKELTGETAEAVMNLGFRISGKESHETVLEAKVKPYINVGGKTLAYPGFLTMKEKI